MSEHEQRKVELMARRLELFEGGDLTEGECPQCGWHVSSHHLSDYGLDCGWGVSPAVREGRMPTRKAVSAGTPLHE